VVDEFVSLLSRRQHHRDKQKRPDNKDELAAETKELKVRQMWLLGGEGGEML
jgi:hypothetical protein